jgi:hypothetical protein
MFAISSKLVFQLPIYRIGYFYVGRYFEAYSMLLLYLHYGKKNKEIEKSENNNRIRICVILC